jgi:hypothetical protein
MFGSEQLTKALQLYTYGGTAELVCELANLPYSRRNAMLKRVQKDSEEIMETSKVSER